MALTSPPIPSHITTWADRGLSPIESVSESINTSRVSTTSKTLEQKKKDAGSEENRLYSSMSGTKSHFCASENFTERDACKSKDDTEPVLSGDDLINSKVYINACKKFDVTPATTYLKSLTTTKLSLRYHSLGPKGAKAIAVALMSNLHIQTLDLEGNCIGSVGTGYIAEMLNENPYITQVNLAENKIGRRGVRALARTMRGNKVIQSLNISGNNLDENDAVYVADILNNNTYLKELNVSYNMFGEAGGKVIGRAIAENVTLACLSLKWNHLRRQGAVYVAQGIRDNDALECIDLSWNGFGLEGCKALAEALATNHTLSELNIASNRITDSAVKELVKGISQNKALFTMKIGNNPITQEGTLEIIKTLNVSESEIQELDLTDLPTDSEFAEVLDKIQSERILEVVPGVETTRSRLPSRANRLSIFDLSDPMMVLFQYMQEKHFRLIDMFHNLDEDGSHTLSRDEFKEGLTKVNIPMSEKALDRLMEQLDEDYDGEISYSELVTGHRKTNRKKNSIIHPAAHRRATLNAKDLDALERLTSKVRTFLKGQHGSKDRRKSKDGTTSLQVVFDTE